MKSTPPTQQSISSDDHESLRCIPLSSLTSERIQERIKYFNISSSLNINTPNKQHHGKER